MAQSILTRRGVLAAGATSLLAPSARAADIPVIRYSTAGGLGPNEIETVIFTDFMRQNVLKRLGHDYQLDVVYARATPEAAMMLSAAQVDMAIMTPPILASSIVKDVIPGGVTVVADCFQDGRDGFASQSFYVLDDSPIHSVADLRGKTIAVNAFGSTPDTVLNVTLRKAGVDRKDLRVVEVTFPSIGAALRSKRVDCGVLPLPFNATELAKGGIRPVFSGKDSLPPFSITVQVASSNFLKAQPGAVKAFLADYVDALHWLYDPANRQKAVEITANLSKSPPEVVDSYFLTNKDYYRDHNACVSPGMLQTLADAMLADGALPHAVDMTKYVDTSFLPFPC
jgi:NitT/TauT family transport system substrate-binding protein